MSEYVFEISKPGEDVNDPDPTTKIFSSKYNSLKIVDQDAISVSVPAAGGTTHTIAHNLGYVPGAVVYGQLSATGSSVMSGAADPNGAGEAFVVRADSTNVYIDLDSNGTAYTAYLYYYILADPGQ